MLEKKANFHFLILKLDELEQLFFSSKLFYRFFGKTHRAFDSGACRKNYDAMDLFSHLTKKTAALHLFVELLKFDLKRESSLNVKDLIALFIEVYAAKEARSLKECKK